jgi:hypothetical protein
MHGATPAMVARSPPKRCLNVKALVAVSSSALATIHVHQRKAIAR